MRLSATPLKQRGRDTGTALRTRASLGAGRKSCTNVIITDIDVLFCHTSTRPTDALLQIGQEQVEPSPFVMNSGGSATTEEGGNLATRRA